MATGPTEVFERLNRKTQREVDNTEKIIDEGLAMATSRGIQTISLPTPAIGRLAEEELRRRYILAGWKSIEFASSQMDGAWVKLTPP